MGQHSFTLLERPELTFSLVATCHPTVLPQGYGTVWGRIDGMLVSFARRGVFHTVSACYTEELGRNGAMEGL